MGGKLRREAFTAGADINEGEYVWRLKGLPHVWPKQLVKVKGDVLIGKALEDAEAFGIVVVEVMTDGDTGEHLDRGDDRGGAPEQGGAGGDQTDG